VKVFDNLHEENPYVTWSNHSAQGKAVVRGSVLLNETLLDSHIDGKQHDMDILFRVYNPVEDRSDIVQRRIFPIVVVADRCIYQGNKLAAPDTYAQFPCPCEGPDCDQPTLKPGINETTTTTTTQITERVILRYCSIYGWDDENSKNYCDDNTDVITYSQTTKVTRSNNGLVIMVGVILIGLLLLMCVGLCLFQRMEVEEDRLRAKLEAMEDTSSSGDSEGSEGEEGESTSYHDHIAREGEQIATKLEILNTRRKSQNGPLGDTQTFKGVITENNKITAAATKVRYQLEQLIATKDQEDSSKKRRLGEQEKRVPLAAAPEKVDDPPAMLVQFPVSIEAHQGNLDLLGSPGDSIPKTTKKSGRIAAELATLALLKETGNLTAEEYLYSKNLVLYE